MRPPWDRELADRVEKLERENDTLREEVKRLRKELEEALRALKRPTAPFSKGEPKRDPQPPGRKRGLEYGQRASRPVPNHIHEQIPVPLPRSCLHCGGRVVYRDTKPQFQEDIVRLTVVRRFDVDIGRCACCGRHVQGRHPLQTSDALGEAGVQLGPEAISLAAHLNKETGLSHERVARILKLGYGLEASRSSICRALMRLGEKAAPTYQELVLASRKSLVNCVDETGWRVAARLHWLWVAVSEEVTVFAILPGRGFDEAASILGKDYDGFLDHDGWRPYYRFLRAYHQTCLSHLIRRCRDLIQTVSPTAARFPLAVKRLLQKGLTLRDRYRAREISLQGLYIATGRMEAAMDRLLQRSWRSPENRRLRKHLIHEQPYLFTFLHCPGIDATNNAAERALRPAVVARKTWGGNRTSKGARSQQILVSILRTCQQQGKDTFSRLMALLRSPAQELLDIVPTALSP